MDVTHGGEWGTRSSAFAVLQRTRDVLAAVDDPLSLLTPVERERAAVLRYDPDRYDFIAAHVLVRVCLAKRFGGIPSDFTVVQECDTCGGNHGQPLVVDHSAVYVSWSHSAGAVGAVVADVPCGMDVEPIEGPLDSALFEYALTPGETAMVETSTHPRAEFLRLWLRKEALVKASGFTLDEVFALDVRDTKGGVMRLGAAVSAGVRRWALSEARSGTHAAAVLAAEGTDVKWPDWPERQRPVRQRPIQQR